MNTLKFLVLCLLIISCSDSDEQNSPQISKTELLTANSKKTWHLVSIGSTKPTESTIYEFTSYGHGVDSNGSLVQKIGAEVYLCDWKWINNEESINIAYRNHPTNFDAKLVKLSQEELVLTISGSDYSFKKHH
jgi:hypothetical protein